jgi:hypothetical protein
LSPLFFAMLWDIDLIFAMWVYNGKLQFGFTFRSGPMIIWPSYGPWNLKFCQIFSFRHFISLWFEILTWFLIRVYNHKLQINFEICSGWMIFGQLTVVGLWNLAKYLVVTTLFRSLWFEILTWFLVWECIIISYRSTLKFVPVEWFLANYLVVTTLFHYDLRYWLDFWYESV